MMTFMDGSWLSYFGGEVGEGEDAVVQGVGEWLGIEWYLTWFLNEVQALDEQSFGSIKLKVAAKLDKKDT